MNEQPTHARFEIRLEYRLRDDADLDAFQRAVQTFVAGIEGHRADSAYTSYQTLEDPRRFVHVGNFAADAVPDLQEQAFFKHFTAALREQCVTPPDVLKLRAVASTRA